MPFYPREIYSVNCDQRGRNTLRDGFRNSNNGTERPFLIISGVNLNKSLKDDGIYALPLTRSGTGGIFAETFDKESLENKEKIQTFISSVILCDKICRIGKNDLNETNPIAKITPKKYKVVLDRINSFVKTNLSN